MSLFFGMSQLKSAGNPDNLPWSISPTRFWVAGGNGQWGSNTNWSTTSGGGSGAAVPAASDFACFDKNSGNPTVNFAVAPSNLGKLYIQNNQVVTFIATGGAKSLTVGDNTSNGYDLGIAANSTLHLSGTTNNMNIIQNNNANSPYVVYGTVKNSGGGSISKAALPTFTFSGGSTYIHSKNGGLIPTGIVWNATSTCNVTGVVGTTITSISTDPSFGNFIWNCAGQTIDVLLGNISTSTVTVKGNMQILNTNTKILSFHNNNGSPILQVNGNLTIGDGSHTTIFNLKTGGSGNATLNLGGNLTYNSNATFTCNINSIVNFGFAGATQTQVVTFGGSGTLTKTNMVFNTVNAPSGKIVNFLNNQTFVNNQLNIVVGTNVNRGSNTLSFINSLLSGSNTYVLPTGCTTMQYLCVAGGGGGGGSSASASGQNGGGGGGAGGMLSGSTSNPTAGNYTVVIGAGGAGSAYNAPGTTGSVSSISGTSLNIIAKGGGGGGGSYPTAPALPTTGGSGGGGGYNYNTTSANGASGYAGQGNAGGNANGAGYQSGGGGGKGSVGGANTAGSGLASSLSGGAVTYAVGGAPSSAGTVGNGATGTANTGTGGGGSLTKQTGSNTGGAGGSGIVIIKYN